MFFEAKFLTLLVFIVLNLLILFVVKTRTTIVISLIVAHLIAVLFFSLSIANFNSFKELVLGLIIYSMVLLFLISNFNSVYIDHDDVLRSKDKKNYLLIMMVGTTFAFVFLLLCLLVINLPKIADFVHDEKLTKQNELMENPLLSRFHPAHNVVKEIYLVKKIDKKNLPEELEIPETNEKKRVRLKDELADNFLLKRLSDMILLIVAVSTSLLLLSKKESET